MDIDCDWIFGIIISFRNTQTIWIGQYNQVCSPTDGNNVFLKDERELIVE